MIFNFLDEKEENKGIVFAELYEIFKNIEKEKVMKIPSQILEIIKKQRDPNLNIKINWNAPLENQKLHEDTINVLGWINLNFWAETQDEKDRLIEIFYSTKELKPYSKNKY